MQLSEVLLLVLINMKQNKSKVFLTSLGIIVGAITIVLVIAIGEGGKADVAEQFKTLNAGTITVSATEGFDMSSMMGMMDMMGGRDMMQDMSGGMSSGMSSGSSSARNSSAGGAPSSGGPTSGGGMSSGAQSAVLAQEAVLTQEMLENLLFFVPDIVEGALVASTETTIMGGDLEEEAQYTLVGTQSSYQSISNLDVAIGSFITDEEVENTTRSVVLGYDVAIEVFGSIIDAYDSKIEIDGRIYVVNGVLMSMGNVTSGIAPDTSIFMPYSTADKYLFDSDITPQFSLLATDVDAVESVMQDTQLVLEQENADATYSIADAGATMDAAMESANTLSLLLFAVAVIVFIVGGIGIMNVLFVSVKERTREIGILKAIGTSKQDILLLFLIEASMIGTLGGGIGVGLSVFCTPLLEKFNISAILTPTAMIAALLFAVVTATIFGIYPAIKASNLVPIEALNNE